MRISDWSSDVCSSDLDGDAEPPAFGERAGRDDAAPERRTGFLYRPRPDLRNVDVEEPALVGQRRLAPRAFQDVDPFGHAFAAVVAAQSVANELVLVVDGALADAAIDAALVQIFPPRHFHAQPKR